ncbi:MAG: DUF1501 domain-containing protein [Thiothrix sp.]|nr:MAG: DUF1501 domain-containing protein [Thiothrix sp.]
MHRREFLKILGLTPFLSLLASSNSFANAMPRIVVLVELKGGNDSLNTLIPYQDPAYYQLRPQLAIPKQHVLNLGEGMGMHPAMQALLPVWNNKEMAWIQGIGVPRQEQARSHFTSIHHWETGSLDPNLDQGWLGQVFPHASPSLQGVAIGNELGPLLADHFNAINLHSPEEFVQYVDKLRTNKLRTSVDQSNPMLAHIFEMQQKLFQASEQIDRQLQPNQTIKQQFPAGEFGDGLSSIARMIISDFQIPIYKLSLGNFDTHVSQSALHQRLLHELSTGLAAFRKVLYQQHKWENVVVLTYSEFGRRASENQSMGTDHGSAAAHFAIGGSVKGGFYGQHPNLIALHAGDIQYHVDFRSVYATLATRWWQQSSPWDMPDIPFIA